MLAHSCVYFHCFVWRTTIQPLIYSCILNRAKGDTETYLRCLRVSCGVHPRLLTPIWSRPFTYNSPAYCWTGRWSQSRERTHRRHREHVNSMQKSPWVSNLFTSAPLCHLCGKTSAISTPHRKIWTVAKRKCHYIPRNASIKRVQVTHTFSLNFQHQFQV